VVKHRAEIAHVEPAFKEVKLNPLAHFEFRSRLLWINGPLSNADIKFTISYLAGTNFWLAFFIPVGSSTRRNQQWTERYRVQSAECLRLALYSGERKAHEKGSSCLLRRSRNRHDYSLHTDTG
jgi:hypothetical protein